MLYLACLILSRLGGWGQVNIKDHLSPAKLELGLSLAIKVIDNGSIKCISSSGSEAPIHVEKVEEPDYENELTPKDVSDVVAVIWA